MHITYRGGYDKLDPQHSQDFILASHASGVQEAINAGKRVGVVTYAKDDGYYDKNIRLFFGEKVAIISHSSLAPQWGSYDVLYLLGGDQVRLHKALLDHSFLLLQLKPDVQLVGDSAGAMVLAAYYYDLDDAGEIHFHEGLSPDSNHIVIVHADNPNYAPEHLFTQVKEFATEHKIEVLMLKENQEVTKEFTK
jgi:hypothetical protein